MSDDWMTAAQSYLERVGRAEYAAFCKRRNPRKGDRFRPSPYLREMCRLLGEGDEEAFKARKMLEGYASEIGV